MKKGASSFIGIPAYVSAGTTIRKIKADWAIATPTGPN